MNSGDVAVNCNTNTSDHVLEVELDEERLLVQGFDEMITGDDGI
jgi:hypothetical protein